MGLEFGILGYVEARDGDQVVDLGHARQRCVLAALLVDANRAVPVDELLDRVWGDRPPQRARGTLYSYLSRLRHTLAAAPGVAVARQRGGYLLTADPVTVDVHRFDDLVLRARAAGDAEDAARLFRQALGLWRGEAFAGLDSPWVNMVRAALDQRRLAVELDRNDAELRLGRHAALLCELLTAAAARPLDERLAGQLMLALYRGGRQADALDRYQRIRVRLAEELGTDPSCELRRLHRQILNGDPALAVTVTVSAHVTGRTGRSARSPLPRQLPAAQPGFTGRINELAELSDGTGVGSGSGDGVTWAISGAGGVGKTWLALRWAHDNIDRFPDGQLYVNLRGFDPTSNPMCPAEAVRLFLDALDVAPAAAPVEAEAQAALYRGLVSDRRMLIVLDNARDTAQVVPLLPGGTTCTVLVTSRHRLAGLVTAYGARPLALGELDRAEARALLTYHLGARMAAEPEAAEALLDHCAGLPLALGIVAARAALHADLPLGALAAELREPPSRLDALDAGELSVNLRAVLTASYLALPPEPARVLELLGLAPGPDFSLAAVASLTALPPDRARVLLRTLAMAHLVQEHPAGRYRMHDLVRLYAAERARALTPEGRRTALHRVLDHYLHTARAAATLLQPLSDPAPLAGPEPGVAVASFATPDQALTWFTDEHRVLLAALTPAAGEFDRHAGQLAATLGTFLYLRGHWHDWVTAQRTALDAARRLGDGRAEAYAHRGLALAYVQLERFADARPHLRRALDLFTALGDQVGQAHTHRSLARVAARQGRFRDALPHAEQALAMYRAAGHRNGEGHALNAVGWFLAHLGDHQQALNCCYQALARHRRVHDQQGQANAWDSLGYAHYHLGHHRRAITCYRRALTLFGTLGCTYPEAQAYLRLGEVYDSTGDTASAQNARRQALAILDRLGYPEPPRQPRQPRRPRRPTAGTPPSRPAGQPHGQSIQESPKVRAWSVSHADRHVDRT